MRVDWVDTAANDLEQIVEHIEQDGRPDAAQRMYQRIYDGAMSLVTMPNRGRQGRKKNTRELVISPFIVVYTIEQHQDRVVILRILHGAQMWPEKNVVG